MRRRFLLLLLLLSGGAVVNVAVAWGCALWVGPTESAYWFGDDRSGGICWTVARFDARGTTLLFSDRVADDGRKIGGVTARSGEIAPAWSRLAYPLREFVNDPNIEAESRTVDGRGWPLRSLSLEFRSLLTRGAGEPAISKRWMIDLDSHIQSPVEWGAWATIRALPLRPIWPGFAINTLFYAAIPWLIFAAPLALRRFRGRRRIKRGLCPKCAYPVGTSDTCTECGAAIKPKAVSA